MVALVLKNVQSHIIVITKIGVGRSVALSVGHVQLRIRVKSFGQVCYKHV